MFHGCLMYLYLSLSKALSVRLVKDRDGRLKGFGYAEFESLQGLMDALSLKGTVSQSAIYFMFSRWSLSKEFLTPTFNLNSWPNE